MKHWITNMVLAAGLTVSAEYTPGVHTNYTGRLNSLNEQQRHAEKLVLAHSMQYMFPGHASFDLDSYIPNGPAKIIGGLFEDLPLHTFHTDSTAFTLKDAKKEIELALEAGADGFIYFYTVNERTSPGQNEIATLLFKAAEELGQPFYITLAITPSHMGRHIKAVEQKVPLIINALGALLKSVGKDHPHWLRTPDGTIVLFTHQASQIGSGVVSESSLARWHSTIDQKMQEIADGYYSVLHALELNACFVYRTAPFDLYTVQLDLPNDQKEAAYRNYLTAACRYFPFLKFFRYDPTPENSAVFQKDMEFFKQANRGFVPSLLYDSYTTRKFDQNNKQIKGLSHLNEPGFDPKKLVARCGYTGNSTYMTELWKEPIQHDLPWFEIITWNDYLEGHALAPSLNHCFGQNVLMKHFKHIWQTGKEPEYGTETFPEDAVVFYKKYKHTIVPSLFNFPVENKVATVPIEFWEKMRDISDKMDVCLFLKEPSSVLINGKPFDAPKGYSMIRLGPEIGQQHIQVVRGGQTVIDFKPTEWVTDEPYRTDRFTFIQSSRWKEIYRKVFPDGEMRFLNEYEKDENGTPNWQKRYPDLIPSGN